MNEVESTIQYLRLMSDSENAAGEFCGYGENEKVADLLENLSAENKKYRSIIAAFHYNTINCFRKPGYVEKLLEECCSVLLILDSGELQEMYNEHEEAIRS